MSSPIVYLPITITWDDGINPVLSSTLPSELVESLTLYNQTITTLNPSTGAQVPFYPGLPQAFAGVINKYFVNPALVQFPTKDLSDAQAAVDSALSAQATAISNAIPTFGVSSPQ